MELSVPISRIAFGGDGVGRLPDGKVCFVPGALPGETVLAEVVHQAKSFARCRLSAVREVADDWLHQKFLGQKATFGDDRSLTNYIVQKHRTYYQDTAIVSTIVPNRHKVFLRQQMRWKRSWLRESVMAGRFMWKKEPLMALFFYLGLVVPMIAPLIARSQNERAESFSLPFFFACMTINRNSAPIKPLAKEKKGGREGNKRAKRTD